MWVWKIKIKFKSKFCKLETFKVWLFIKDMGIQRVKSENVSHSVSQATGVGCHALLQGIFLNQVLHRVSCIAGATGTKH